jgi:hypothetical protein|tara:strand:+ start:236 stop:418 length:183 start_codon:yes stop_codon:yes gene_type:complete
MNYFKNLHPARIGAFFEACVACIAAFLPLSGQQVATICAVIAIATGEQLRRKVVSAPTAE